MVVSNLRNGEGTIVLSPNCSASWRVNKLFIAALGGLTLTLAFFLAMVGAWVILPFAGLEVGLLAYFMHRVCRITHTKEVLHVAPEGLRLESGVQYPVDRWRFTRKDAYLQVAKPRHALDVQTVFLCDLQGRVELGRFLNSGDKKQLLQLAASIGLPIKRQPPLQEARLPA